MTGFFAVKTLLELAAIAAVIYGFVREDKLIAFEKRVAGKIRAAKTGRKAKK